MKRILLISLIFSSISLSAQNKIESILNKDFTVIQIEGIDQHSEFRTFDLESINSLKNPLFIKIRKYAGSEDFDYSLSTKIVNGAGIFFNLNGDKIESSAAGPYTKVGGPKKLIDFEIFLRNLLARLEKIEINDEFIVFSNTGKEKIIIKK
ncbi:MAG: hypothetical protein R2750_10180 [Bacteroidales bacterium]